MSKLKFKSIYIKNIFVKNLLLTEQEKKTILSMYGLVVEQEEQPQTQIPSDWKAYSQEINNYIDGLKDIKVSLKDTDRKNTKYSTTEDEIPINRAIRLSTTEGYGKFEDYLQRAVYARTEAKKLSIMTNYNTFQSMVNDFKEAWYNTEGKGNEIVVKINKTTPEEYTIKPVQGPQKVKFELDWRPNTNEIDFYPNNGWEVSKSFIRQFNEKIINPILLFKEQRSDIKIILDKLEIYTSASRLRNTGLASNLSFAELSEKRNNTAKDYIINSLTSYGVDGINEVSVVQNYLGTNHPIDDGSSGPNPPKPYQYIKGGKGVKMNPPMPDESLRNQFGPPHDSLDEYNQYKYLNVLIVLKAEITASLNPVNDLIFFYTYQISIGDKVVPIKPPKIPPFKPKLDLGLIKFITDNFRIKPEKCAAYD